MNRSILYGLVATWLAALALAAGWIVFARGRDAQTMQVLLVAFLPLMVALLVSNRLLPLLKAPQQGAKKPDATGGKAVRGKRGPGRKAAAQRQGLFGLSLFHRRATERQSAPSPSANAASPQATGTAGQQASTVPQQRVPVASATTAPQAALAPVPAAQPLPPVGTPAVHFAPSFQLRETPVGADAAERIRAMQREVERLHVRLEEELGRIGTIRESSGSALASRSTMLSEVRAFLQNSKEQNNRLLQEAGSARHGIVQALESVQRMLGELDAITAAIRGELAQAEAFERFVEGQPVPSDLPARHVIPAGPEPATPPPPANLPSAEDARPAAPSVRPEPPPAPPAQPRAVLPVEATQQGAPSAASRGTRESRPEPSVEELLRGITFDREESGPAPKPGARPAPPSETPEGRPARPAPPQPAGRPQAAGPKEEPAQGESLERALERAFGSSLGQPEGPARPSEARTPPTVRPQPSPPRPSSPPQRGVEEELADVLGNLQGWSAEPTSQQEHPHQVGDGGSSDGNGAATVTVGAEAFSTPYTGTFFIMVKPLLGGTAFGKFWTALEKVLGVGRVVGSTPLRDKSALRLTVDMGEDQVMVSQLVSGIPDAEFHRIDEKNLEITLSDA